ncbi:kelch-like protein 7 [Sitodiplosis mosellana]|uniref:kelch-like protein 7 n=1 Tax=Sitodiplosis mosellana TaxID=263140 RepID=UPI002443C957|nr:kelch-like protein 7 [Sitodiplosis mosellana]
MERLLAGESTDCKIIVRDRTIPTHKLILNDFPYFKIKFDEQSGYNYEIVSEMVKYMYSFKVKISTENVEDLLKISDEYEVARLFEKAQKFIVERIGTENVFDCLTLTEHITNAKLLKSASIDYILDHYSELESEKKLSWDLLKEILHHEKLNQRITNINAENADELLDIAKMHHVKNMTEAVKNFMNQV